MFFRIDRVGEAIGHSRAYEVELGGVLKLDELPDAPWEVANEYICGALAAMLGLPVPPGAIVSTERGPGYASLRFGQRSTTPPPLMNESALIAADPDGVAGIVAFDIWVWNPDRNRENVAFAPPHYPLTVFDHGDALLSDKHRPSIDKRLQGAPGSFLASALRSSDPFGPWVRRIGRVDRAQIEAIVDRARTYGVLSREDARRALDFLVFRQLRIRSLLESCPQLQHLTWSPIQ